METTAMGKVIVAAKIENLEDLFDVQKGILTDDKVRRIDVPDALVDTGASGLMMPKRLITGLGLRPMYTRQARGIGGTVSINRYGAVRLHVQGRDCHID